MRLEQRGAQWERLIDFAQQCDEAYEQGLHAAMRSFPPALIIDPGSTMGSEVERQLATTQAEQPESAGGPMLQRAREHWYQIGLERQRDALHEVIHAPWQHWEAYNESEEQLLPR